MSLQDMTTREVADLPNDQVRNLVLNTVIKALDPHFRPAGQSSTGNAVTQVFSLDTRAVTVVVIVG